MVEKKTESAKSEDSTKVVLPGTGENTPDPAAAAKEHEKAIESVFDEVDPEYDPLAHRDPARNSDDRANADAALRPSDFDERVSGVQQIAQFDESSGQSVLHSLANPSKAAIEAEKVDVNARRDDDPVDDALRAAIDAAAERKVASTDVKADAKARDEKSAPVSSATRDSTATRAASSRTAAKK